MSKYSLDTLDEFDVTLYLYEYAHHCTFLFMVLSPQLH